MGFKAPSKPLVRHQIDSKQTARQRLRILLQIWSISKQEITWICSISIPKPSNTFQGRDNLSCEFSK